MRLNRRSPHARSLGSLTHTSKHSHARTKTYPNFGAKTFVCARQQSAPSKELADALLDEA